MFNKKIKDRSKEDETSKLVESIKEKYNKASIAKSDLHSKWKKCEKAYDGSLFYKDVPTYKPQLISNLIFSTIETVKPIMLSNYPRALVIPSVPEAFEKSQVVQRALDYEWRREKMFGKLLDLAHSELVYGTACFGLFWDSKASNGLGEISCKVISPFNMFPAPSATNENNAEYIIYATYKSLGELSNMYPDKREELMGQVTNDLDSNIATERVPSDSGQNILYIECYHRDYSSEIVEEEEDGEVKKYKKRKYPNGRRTIVGGEVLLDDGENPYQDGRFPFLFTRCYPLPNNFWGVGEVENLISPQENRCRIQTSIVENAELMGNPMWIMDKNCGVDKGSLTNQKGLVIRKNPGTQVLRDVPPSMPMYISDLPAMISNDIENISGVYDVLKGNRIGSITASTAIESLNEQAQGRIKLKVQNLEGTIADLGAMWLSRIQQFWETIRTIRVMSDKIDPNAISMQMGGQIYNFYDVARQDLDGDFDVEVVAGSTMQQNKSARLNQMIQLASTPAEDGLPMVDRQTVLESTDLENVQDIINRLDAVKQELSENQGGQAQAQVEGQMQMQREKLESEKQKAMFDRGQAEKKDEADKEFELKKIGVQAKADIAKEIAKIATNEQLKSITEGIEEGEYMNPLEKLKGGSGGSGNPLESMASMSPQEAPQPEQGGEATEEDMAMIKEIIEILSQLSPEEVQQLMEEQPELKAFIEALQEQGIDILGMIGQGGGQPQGQPMPQGMPQGQGMPMPQGGMM